MTLTLLEGRLKLKAEKLRSESLRRKAETTFHKVSEAAVRWKHQARQLLNKPASKAPNTSLYPRRRSGKLRNSIYYRIRKHIGKTTASLKITYGFHEVYSTHSKVYSMFPYGKFLNEQYGASYSGYRERLTGKLVDRINTIIRNTKRI